MSGLTGCSIWNNQYTSTISVPHEPSSDTPFRRNTPRLYTDDGEDNSKIDDGVGKRTWPPRSQPAKNNMKQSDNKRPFRIRLR